MELGLEGKVAIVTGGSEGIGRATALRFAKEGARVAICARRAEPLEAVAREIRDAGGQVLARSVDVMQAEPLRAFVDEVAAHFGRLDILVNNAGTSIARHFGDVDDETWHLDIELKLHRGRQGVEQKLTQPTRGNVLSSGGFFPRVKEVGKVLILRETD